MEDVFGLRTTLAVGQHYTSLSMWTAGTRDDGTIALCIPGNRTPTVSQAGAPCRPLNSRGRVARGVAVDRGRSAEPCHSATGGLNLRNSSLRCESWRI